MPECGSYEVVREGEEIIVRVDCEACPFFPSVEDEPRLMARTIDILSEAGRVTKLVFVQKRDFEYDESQVSLLSEIAAVYSRLVKQKFAYGLLARPECSRYVTPRYAKIQDILYRHFKSDPIGAYVELKRLEREERRLREEKLVSQEEIACLQNYYRLLEESLALIEKTRLIQLASPYLPGFVVGDRSIYRRILAPTIKPDFMFTKLMASYPAEGEEIASYLVGDTEVTIFELPDTVQYLYHMIPTEFKLTEEKYELLDAARKILAEHKPKRTEFVDPERMRQVFTSVGSDLIEELAGYRGIHLRENEVEELTEILVRYTVGFGLVEVLLADEQVQDITINSPMGRIPIFIVHGEFGDCTTNIIPTMPEGESWASKLRMISGRPLDEANPILDTELVLPRARARVASITAPLNPTGLAFALRRHRDKPWTLPLFVANRMLTPLAAGLISFFVDGSRTLLVAGTRSAGKTSLLGSVMTEIMRKGRIVTIEDSVAWDSQMLIKRNGRIERTTIGKLIDSQIEKYGCWYELSGYEVLGNDEGIEVLAMDREGKIRFRPVSKFIRHKIRKPIYEVRTRTGRAIKVTGDHSLFSLGEDGYIVPIKVSSLRKGSRIATPRVIELCNKPLRKIDLLEQVLLSDNSFLRGTQILTLLKENFNEIKRIGSEYRYSKSAIQYWRRNRVLPGKIVRAVMREGILFDKNERLEFKLGKNAISWLPTKIELDSDFLMFIGLWLADGCYDRNSVILSVVASEEREIVERVAEKFGLKAKMHSDKISLMINSGTFKKLLKEFLGLSGNAYTKRIPDWVFGLSKAQIACLLKGIFSGDGCAADKELTIPIASRKMLSDIQTLLLAFGINLRIGAERTDGTHNASITATDSLAKFKRFVGFLQKNKQAKLEFLCAKKSTHDSSDTIPLPMSVKKKLRMSAKKFNWHDYIVRENDVGRVKLSVLTQQLVAENLENPLVKNLQLLAQSDIFWDEIKEIRICEEKEMNVYDISVPECESFVCENVIAHNTLELPVSALRALNYNIQSMKVASAMTRGTTEVSADEGIRTTLRLGDSSLIVGEVRSTEARALYEAMRVGALANVVAGTIHGDSPYGVFDRVVNDLNVPRTSFKATDIIVIANPVRSPDGIHRWRRVTQITEVRKFWEEDPLREGGFVDLMKYDATTDALVPTPDLLHGESDIIKAVAGNVREWAGNWDAVWDNIQLRAKTKQTLVEYSQKLKNPNILEAEFYVLANDAFHKVSEQVREEVGRLDSERIFFKWNEWLKRAVKKL